MRGPDPGDFVRLVVEAGPRLHRTAFLLTGDNAAAEDLLQDALAATFARWSTVRLGDSPEGYVRTVMVNARRGWWRRLGRREVLTAEPPHRSLPSAESQIDDRELLRRALRALPERQRVAVVLRYYDDLPEAEVARIMGCGVGTVKSQAARGLAKLRVVLGPEPVPVLPAAPRTRSGEMEMNT